MNIDPVSWAGNAKAKAPSLSNVDSTDWLSKVDAAILLGVHPRQLERRAKDGYVRKRVLPKRRTEKKARVVYSREDIEGLRRQPPEAELDEDEIQMRNRVKGPIYANGPGRTSDWLAKEPAAARLGVGMRQLENRAAKAEIRKKLLPRQPNERAARVLYSIEDIDAIKAGQPNHHGAPEPEAKPEAQANPQTTAPGALAPARAFAAGDPFAGLAAHLARLAEAFPAPSTQPKPWMNLTEAAAWSGLPAAWLVAQAKAGAAFAVNVGQGTKAHWRFNRDAIGSAQRS